MLKVNISTEFVERNKSRRCVKKNEKKPKICDDEGMKAHYIRGFRHIIFRRKDRLKREKIFHNNCYNEVSLVINITTFRFCINCICILIMG